MPRNRVQLAWLPLLVIGCGKPTSEAVHVDLESLITAPRPELASSLTPPAPMAGNRTTLPGLPATTLRAQGDRELAEMRKLIEADRDRALTALTRRLARLYAEQAKRREDEIMGPLRDLIESATKEAYAAVSLALQEYADQPSPRKEVATLPNYAPYAEWARWFLSDSPDRPIAPGFTIAKAEARAFVKDQPTATTAEPATP